MNIMKVGDRVRALKNAYEGLLEGTLGTVEYGPTGELEVRWDGDPIPTIRPEDVTWLMYPSEIELVEEEQ